MLLHKCIFYYTIFNKSTPNEPSKLGVSPESETYRLEVNLNSETREALEGWAICDDVTVTEEVRRAIAMLAMFKNAEVDGRVSTTVIDGKPVLMIAFQDE